MVICKVCGTDVKKNRLETHQRGKMCVDLAVGILKEKCLGYEKLLNEKDRQVEEKNMQIREIKEEKNAQIREIKEEKKELQEEYFKLAKLPRTIKNYTILNNSKNKYSIQSMPNIPQTVDEKYTLEDIVAPKGDAKFVYKHLLTDEDCKLTRIKVLNKKGKTIRYRVVTDEGKILNEKSFPKVLEPVFKKKQEKIFYDTETENDDKLKICRHMSDSLTTPCHRRRFNRDLNKMGEDSNEPK